MKKLSKKIERAAKSRSIKLREAQNLVGSVMLWHPATYYMFPSPRPTSAIWTDERPVPCIVVRAFWKKMLFVSYRYGNGRDHLVGDGGFVLMAEILDSKTQQTHEVELHSGRQQLRKSS